MKVLLISHNVISETNNMGKTMLSYFQAFAPEEIAEFYIQEKEPKNASVCNSFYRITDRDALKSVFWKKVGTSFHLTKSWPESVAPTIGAVETIRQYGRKRNAPVYIMRNAVWSLAHWKSKEMLFWLHDFNPDVIFFMSGDYSFMYKITLEIQEMLQKPLVVCCVDDYYLYNRNEGSALGRLQHRSFMKSVNRLMDKASCILTTSDSMGDAYHKLFNKPCFTLHTSAKRRSCSDKTERSGIAYFGNLGFRRFEQVAEIGKAVKRLNVNNIHEIDVYSGEKNPDNLMGLTRENGVHFHGEISSADVAARMDKCLAIIHTESFRPEFMNMTRYSVSTKIADSLLNGPCLIAYGPEGIASIDYLKKNKAAYVITRPEDLENGLREVLTNEELRAEIVENARVLGSKNHDESVNPQKVRKWLQMAVDGTF